MAKDKQSAFNLRADDRSAVVMTEVYLEKRESERDPSTASPIPLELRRAGYASAQDSFESLCDMAHLHPIRWLLYKASHAFNSDHADVIARVDETIKNGNV